MSPERQSEMSDRAAYLIPPLPKAKVRVDNESKARSPLKPKSRTTQSLTKNGLDKAGLLSPDKIRLRGSRKDHKEGPITSKGVLAPLSFSNNGEIRANRNSVTADKENVLALRPSARRSVLASCRPVIQSQETLESVLDTPNISSEEYRRLCQEITDGRSDDAASWRRLLDLARRHYSSSENQGIMPHVFVCHI